MLRAALALFWIILSAACTSPVSVTQEHIPDAAYQADPLGIRYINAAGTSQAFVSHGIMYLGPTESEAVRLHHQMREAHTDGLQVSGCSDETFLCTRAGRLVFAVPRARLSSQQIYDVQGIRFSVDRCDNSDCSAAGIRAVCLHLENGACSLGDTRGGESVTLVTFGYDRTKGIVWLLPFPMFGDNQDVERRYLLSGDRGLLAPS